MGCSAPASQFKLPLPAKQSTLPGIGSAVVEHMGLQASRLIEKVLIDESSQSMLSSFSSKKVRVASASWSQNVMCSSISSCLFCTVFCSVILSYLEILDVRCSGTGCFELGVKAAMMALAKYSSAEEHAEDKLPDVVVETAFAVEFVPAKQQWLMDNVLEPGSCLFSDVTKFNLIEDPDADADMLGPRSCLAKPSVRVAWQ